MRHGGGLVWASWLRGQLEKGWVLVCVHESGPKRSALHRCDPRHCPQATSEPWTRSEAAPSAAPRASPTSARWPRSACACVCSSCVRLPLPPALLQGMAGHSQGPSARPREIIGPFQFPQHHRGGTLGPSGACRFMLS